MKISTVKAKYRRFLSRLGGVGWEVLSFAVECYFVTARPDAYILGRRHIDAARALEKRGLIEIERNRGSWIGRLTELGKLALLEGTDPMKLWNESWDGKWHFLLFDLPRRCNKERQSLRKWLQENRLGCLQGSLWISPRPMDDEILDYEEIGVKGDQLLISESTIKGTYKPRDIVNNAWDFKAINQGYQKYMEQLRLWKKKGNPVPVQPVLQGWNEAARRDPFLPKEILPKGYLGKKAWDMRCSCLAGK